MSMFCRQCEQAAKETGCEVMGVCGKNPEVAALLDLMLYGLKGLAIYADKAREFDTRYEVADKFLIEGLFTTVTNVDFDPVQLAGKLRKCFDLKEKVKALYETAYREKNGGHAPQISEGPAAWVIANDLETLVAQGREHGVKSQQADPDLLSAIEIIIYGLKGMAAYADHAMILGKTDEEVFAFFHHALAATCDPSKGLMDLVGIAMECGKLNIKVMAMLNEGHIERYGSPTPTKVQLGSRKNKGILVSGHDLRMLEELLKQTEGKGIDIYTHGEMLPAHGYPGLKKYGHLYANFGGAWQDQHKEFPNFPGAIIFNTNCIQRPAESYKDRLFTWGEVGWPGVKHLSGWNFGEVINKALECPDLPEAPGKEILVGFGHDAVLGVADKVIEAVKSGAIKHFFLIGGCDGAKPGRNYYTEFAEKVPKDAVILTLACGKYRFNKLDFGDIGGIPRLLDVGQCNDAYSAVRIALALAGAFNCGVNDLPLSFILSWYEQKAHVILLSLLHLGIKNIKLGPALPAYLSPNVLNFLVENFNIGRVGDVDADLKVALGAA
ncbi:hydroxylamine reductase [Geomonas silvestris]|uniref:Hydroxylamine reductase n=1 Tax=Geomonas silvestris TaxID=2740184 RepID=A0A6V8ME94_9BACT|nr:hydroxylamine reductase [Geomonas silvestris]GFO58310.1 hydroxylamine reductase [Geomonas silvestris]